MIINRVRVSALQTLLAFVAIHTIFMTIINNAFITLDMAMSCVWLNHNANMVRSFHSNNPNMVEIAFNDIS